MRTDDRGDLRILFLDPAGPRIPSAMDTTDLIGDAWGVEATAVAVPVARLDPEFFELSTRVAGEVAQKLVTYRIRLIVVGDIAPFEAASSAFRDWVRESNRGDQVWFVADEAALDAKLVGRAG